jgi:hypothetical protein
VIALAPSIGSQAPRTEEENSSRKMGRRESYREKRAALYLWEKREGNFVNISQAVRGSGSTLAVGFGF